MDKTPSRPSRTAHDLDSTEVLVLARQAGQVSLWGCWKRQLAAFHDPAMWESVDAFARYFEPLAGPDWEPPPYGFVVVDFDTRQVISANDWSTPSSMHPIADNEVWDEGPNPALAPLQALSHRPDCWPQVRLRVAKPPSPFPRPGKPPAIEEVTMDHAMVHGATAEDFMEAMTVRRGLVKLPALGRRLFLEATFLPAGWVQHDDRGKELPAWLIDQLAVLKDWGFPAPNWQVFDERLADSELPLDPLAFDELQREAEGGDKEAAELLAQGHRYRALKAAWHQEPNPPSPAAPRP